MNIKTINCPTLKEWLGKNQAILIDVREIEENKAARIEGATLIPLTTVDLTKIPDFKNKKLVIHCRSGKRSETACAKLLEQNPNLDIYNLEGGILAWANCGFPVIENNV